MPAQSKANQSFKCFSSHYDRIDSIHELGKPQVVALGNWHITQPVQTSFGIRYIAIYTGANVNNIGHAIMVIMTMIEEKQFIA